MSDLVASLPLFWALVFSAVLVVVAWVSHKLGYQDGYDEGRSVLLLERAAIICTRAHADPVEPRYGPQRIQAGAVNVAADPPLLSRPPHHYDDTKFG